MDKLTLSVDKQVVARAKRYARANGTSVSRLVEKILDVASAPSASRTDEPAVLARLRGSLKGGAVRDYHRYLEQKYR